MLNFSEKGEGDVIVLIHGLFGSLSNLGNCARHLSEHFRTVSVDVRNHGDSFHTDTMSYAEMTADVVALLEQLSVPQTHILGHSMGGKIAMNLALNYPQLVNKLAVIDMSPLAYQRGHDSILEGLSQLVNTSIDSRSQADAILQNYVEGADIRSFLLKNLIRSKDGSNIHYDFKMNLKAIIDNYPFIIESVDGQSFSGETLFVKGEHSNYLKAEHRDTILRLFPNTVMREISATGHWPHSEKPVVFNAIIEKFFR